MKGIIQRDKKKKSKINNTLKLNKENIRKKSVSEKSCSISYGIINKLNDVTSWEV